MKIYEVERSQLLTMKNPSWLLMLLWIWVCEHPGNKGPLLSKPGGPSSVRLSNEAATVKLHSKADHPDAFAFSFSVSVLKSSKINSPHTVWNVTLSQTTSGCLLFKFPWLQFYFIFPFVTHVVRTGDFWPRCSSRFATRTLRHRFGHRPSHLY